jgi:hypothetical protein
VRLAAISSLIVLACCASVGERGVLSGGALSADDEVAVLDAVVRYGIANAEAPCANYGSKDAFCLSVSDGQDPPHALLSRLRDVRPRVLPLSACRRQGIIVSVPQTTDPSVDVEWLKVIPDGRVRAHVKVYCSVGEPLLCREGTSWAADAGVGGWVGCGPIPGDCTRPVR